MTGRRKQIGRTGNYEEKQKHTAVQERRYSLWERGQLSTANVLIALGKRMRSGVTRQARSPRVQMQIK